MGVTRRGRVPPRSYIEIRLLVSWTAVGNPGKFSRMFRLLFFILRQFGTSYGGSLMSTKNSAGPSPSTGGWRHKSNILNTFNAGHRHLEDWVTKGFVRTAKLDERKQGRRLYNAEDVNATIIAISEGREPRRVAGRRGVV